VRFGGTLGSAVGAQTGWEIASRFLPGPLSNSGMVARLAYRLSVVGGGSVAGQVGGEAAGRAAYDKPSAAPGSYEPPPRSLGEEASRMVGGAAGALTGALVRNPVKGFAMGVGGQLAGEELAARTHGIIARYYGDEVASRAARASLPNQSPPA
jgi:hypothetical protein